MRAVRFSFAGKVFQGKTGEGVFVLSCFVGSLELVVAVVSGVVVVVVVVVVVIFMTFALFIKFVLSVDNIKQVVFKFLKKDAISTNKLAPAVKENIGTILTIGAVRQAPVHKGKKVIISFRILALFVVEGWGVSMWGW